MKRTTIYLAALGACAFLFTLTACGGPSDQPNDNTESNAISQTEDDTTGAEVPTGEDKPGADDGASESDAQTSTEIDTDTPSDETSTDDSAETGTLTDEEILEKVEPYLEELVYQDPAGYTSFGDFLKSNLNLDEANVSSATLYMGAPNQNTGYFLMLTPTETADMDLIHEQLERQAEAMVHTAEQGYTQGYAEYSILEESGRVFLVMQPTAEQYQDLIDTLSGLGD